MTSILNIAQERDHNTVIGFTNFSSDIILVQNKSLLNWRLMTNVDKSISLSPNICFMLGKRVSDFIFRCDIRKTSLALNEFVTPIILAIRLSFPCSFQV